MSQPQTTNQNVDAFKYFFSNLGEAVVKLFQAVAPEIKKFDEDLKKIEAETEKIKNKTTTKSKPKPKSKPKQPGKPELKVLS